MQEKRIKKKRRHKKIRSKVFGTKSRPRLFVFRSNKHIYAQLINDENEKVLAVATDATIKTKKGNKINSAFQVGKMIAKEASEKNIEKVVFDRGGYIFHGRVKSLADGAREGGLKF